MVGRMPSARTSKAAWIALGCLLAGFVVYGLQTPSVELFGHIYFDDAIYFSSAKALAQGDGFVVPNTPGSPAQTKYPFLYPWLLSLVWQWAPEFPANVGIATALNCLLSCVFLGLSFVYLRRMGLSEWPALVCIGLTATQTQFVNLSVSLMSEPLFMALGIGSLLLIEAAVDRDKPLKAVGAGALMGLAFLARTSGVAFWAGVVAWALLRLDSRKALLFVAGSAPFIAGHFIWTATATAPPPPADAPLGWVELWAYTTSYADFWRLSVPSFEAFTSMLGVNILVLVMAPAGLPLLEGIHTVTSFFATLAVITLSAGVVSGIVRQAKSGGVRTVHASLVFTAALGLIWNEPIQWRLLLFFVPLFCAGAWIEGADLLGKIRKVLQSNEPFSQKAVAGAMGLAVAAVGLWTVAKRVEGRIDFQTNAAAQAASYVDHEEVYDWVRENTRPDEVVLSYTDARLYLETGRQSAWPLWISLGNAYPGQEPMERRFERFFDIAEYLDARYLVLERGDVSKEGEPGEKKLVEIQQRFPVALETANELLRIYDLSSLHRRPSLSETPAEGAVVRN